MKPYFETHPIGVLYYVVVLGWYLMEFIQLLRQQEWRQSATRIRAPGYLAAWAGVAIVTLVALFSAPHIAPAADIGHGTGVFAIGMVMLVAGAALRTWSFRSLGRYFTFSVKVSPDQPVVSSGPYRVLRHPGYAGGLLALLGIGLLYGNWAGWAAIAVLWTPLIVWRIRVEERALLTTLDASYRSYAGQHKRLVPLVW
jgi:protein-S-isoprenylcysteine O-methyltransferase Ste14